MKGMIIFMKIIDNSARITKFSSITTGTVFKLENEYYIKIDSIYDGADQIYRNAINLHDYRVFEIDQGCDVYPYYDVTLSLK